jgi:hypothetical protein
VKRITLREMRWAPREAEAREQCGRDVHFSGELFGPAFPDKEAAERHWSILQCEARFWRIVPVDLALRRKGGRKRGRFTLTPQPRDPSLTHWQLLIQFWKPFQVQKPVERPALPSPTVHRPAPLQLDLFADEQG